METRSTLLKLRYNCILSETHYSLKEMETCICHIRIVSGVILVGNPLLSERDGNSTISTPLPVLLGPSVGNPLLSERDGNWPIVYYSSHLSNPSRKPTTLWKRWKRSPPSYRMIIYYSQVGNPLLSERDGNFKNGSLGAPINLHVGNPLLSERDGNHKWEETRIHYSASFGRKPTTLWKRWKLTISRRICATLLGLSETHYSLKEMETCFRRALILLWFRNGRKPTTLWKRWKLCLVLFFYPLFFRWSETHYSLKEMETTLLKSTFRCHYLIGRKPTTLWKRWKLEISPLRDISIAKFVGNPLLSERDGNFLNISYISATLARRSETHYSLKEMETSSKVTSS